MSLALSQFAQFTFWQRDDRKSDFQEKGKIIHMGAIQGLVWIKKGKADHNGYNGLNISL